MLHAWEETLFHDGKFCPNEPRVQLPWTGASPPLVLLSSDQPQALEPSSFLGCRLSGGNISFVFFFLSVSLYIVACTPLPKMTG